MSEKKVSCDCGKSISASTDEQLIRDVQAHAKNVHAMDLTGEQVLAMAQPVG